MPGVRQFIFLIPQRPRDVEIFYKSPSEQVQLEAVFKNELTGNPYTLTSSSVTAIDSSGADVSGTLIGAVVQDHANGTVKAVIRGGTSGQKYLIKFQAASTENPALLGPVKLKVKEVTP